MDNYDKCFKLLTIGDAGVGKSSLLCRFADKEFSEQYVSTIGIDFKVRWIKVDNLRVKLQIWDTAGQERFRTITSSYYRGAQAIIICYDITNRKSYYSLPGWRDEILRYCDIKPILFLCGTKRDLQAKRKVSEDEALEYASQNGMTYFETSSSQDFNVVDLFKGVTSMLIAQDKNNETKYMNDLEMESSSDSTVSLLGKYGKGGKQKRSRCC